MKRVKTRLSPLLCHNRANRERDILRILKLAPISLPEHIRIKTTTSPLSRLCPVFELASTTRQSTTSKVIIIHNQASNTGHSKFNHTRYKTRIHTTLASTQAEPHFRFTTTADLFSLLRPFSTTSLSATRHATFDQLPFRRHRKLLSQLTSAFLQRATDWCFQGFRLASRLSSTPRDQAINRISTIRYRSTLLHFTIRSTISFADGTRSPKVAETLSANSNSLEGSLDAKYTNLHHHIRKRGPAPALRSTSKLRPLVLARLGPFTLIKPSSHPAPNRIGSFHR